MLIIINFVCIPWMFTGSIISVNACVWIWMCCLTKYNMAPKHLKSTFVTNIKLTVFQILIFPLYSCCTTLLLCLAIYDLLIFIVMLCCFVSNNVNAIKLCPNSCLVHPKHSLVNNQCLIIHNGQVAYVKYNLSFLLFKLLYIGQCWRLPLVLRCVGRAQVRAGWPGEHSR